MTMIGIDGTMMSSDLEKRIKYLLKEHKEMILAASRALGLIQD